MTVRAPRGTFDVLPVEQPIRESIVKAAETAAADYAYGRITTPTFEETTLFVRTAGEGSDVVEKEMYTFEDRSGRSLTLRPEGTAPVARAYVEHGLHRAPQPVKTFFVGPMFRYAAPQRGRYREFWQLNFEAMGSDDPALDAELIQLFAEIAARAEIRDVRLELNSIGDRECRPAYVERLRAFLGERWDELDEDARRKAEKSPLRVFDTKSPGIERALADAPRIADALCSACRDHFGDVRSFLDAYGIAYELRPALVRGLDYYTRTVWEFKSDALEAAQSAVCAGGRYDYLIEEIGGPPTPGVGWAAGLERLTMASSLTPERPAVDVFLAFADGVHRRHLVPLLATLRRGGRAAETDYARRSLKGQLTHAQRLGARTIVVAGADGLTVRRRGEKDVDVKTVEEAIELL